MTEQACPTIRRQRRDLSRHRGDPSLIQAATRLAATEIAFVDHPSFRRRNPAHELTIPLIESATPVKVDRRPGIAFLPEMVGTALLSHAEEQQCFLQMNYHRYRAERLRRKLRPHDPDAELIAEIEGHLAEAERLRNWIARANVRLVVAAAKRLCHTIDQLCDLVGEGLMPLMRAIDLFDAGRGHRFSTYATWAVRNQIIRTLRRQRNQPHLALTDEQADWQHIPDHRAPVVEETESPVLHAEVLNRLLPSLSEREQRILRARFGLDGEPAGQSLSQISSTLGLSKERVRQIVLIALSKLREQAVAAGLTEQGDCLFAT